MAVSQIKLLTRTNVPTTLRFCSSLPSKKGLVLGVYTDKKTNNIALTSVAKRYDELTKGKLSHSIKSAASNKIKPEQSFVFWNLCEKYRSVAVVGIGDPGLAYDELEVIDKKREAVRVAAHVGVQTLKKLGINHVDFDGMSRSDCVAEGASLSTFSFTKYHKDTPPAVKIGLYDGDHAQWQRGVILGSAQNWARTLMETPSNYKTPTRVAELAHEQLTARGVTVEVRNKQWIETMKMGGLLSVARGSSEPPVFLELSYKGGANRPVVLVGKGVTFDAGGYALKPSKGMDLMRGDCGGACCVLGAIQAAARLELPINITGLIPLCENLINGQATKPGDVITMHSGKTVAVDNPDAEGRLILGDALSYSGKFEPEVVLDVATLTGAIHVALGTAATGVFTNSSQHWELLRKAGSLSGDRVWRMPLWDLYARQLTDYTAYDVNNIGGGTGGGSCTAAAFLRQFVPENVPWAHLDIAGVSGCGGPTGDKIIPKGMTGRSTRTLVYFLEALGRRLTPESR